MLNKNRLWLVVLMSALLMIFIVSIGIAVNAVRSMQTTVSVESLEQALTGSVAPIDIAVPTDTATPTPSSTLGNTPPAPSGSQRSSGLVSEYISLLDQLPTDDAPSAHSGYNRDYFNAWIDADGDGCDTRAEVLLMESLSAVTTRGRCTISTGQWVSVYDGVSSTQAGDFDIDHFVPLNEAWMSGAYNWDSATRVHFGNDVEYSYSLVAVTASSNRSKSDKDPSQWMPASKAYFCDYVATWVAVKWRWSLSVDTLERMTLKSVLGGCSDVSITLPEKATVATGAPPELVAPVSDGVLDPDYGTCSVVQANGAGPYYQGIDPEYAWYRDGDKDGMVCE
jgi:hypothetical protein